jgi:hypothetical protein
MRGSRAGGTGALGSRLVFWPCLDASASRVEDESRVDAGPRFAGAGGQPRADEVQRPAWRQRPRPPPVVLIMRSAAAAARSQDRPRRLGVPARPPASDRAAIGELQADLEGRGSRDPVPCRAGRRVFVPAGEAWPDETGHEELESPGVGPDAGNRDRGPLRPAQQQGTDWHYRRKFRLRRIPWARHPGDQRRARHPPPWCLAKAHDTSFDLACLVTQRAQRIRGGAPGGG